MSGFTRRHWRSPTFVVVFLTLSAAWLVVVGSVTWLFFHPVTDWVGRQHELLQELCSLVVLLPWALFLAAGIGGAAHLAEGAAGLRSPYGPGQTHGSHAKWSRPRSM
jgi:hypothetical protein